MDTKLATVEVADDGTVVLPADVVRTMSLSPHQTLVIEEQHGTLVLKPTGRESLERIRKLVSAALSGVEWSEIEATRTDRCS